MLSYPLADDMSTLNQWITGGQWGLTTNSYHSGPTGLTDSPTGNYTPNSDDAAQTSVDLRLAQWPVLRFWDRYAIGGSGRAAVDVAGTSTYIVNGTQNSWQPEAIDLSWWVGQASVPIKFRLNRWSGEQADGWYLDDVSVAEQVPLALGYPFFDNFESGLGNWIPSTWHIITSSPYEGTNCVYSLVADNANMATEYPLLSLAGWIDLSNAVNPQLIFYYQGTSCNDFNVQVATQGSGFSSIWHDNYCGGYGWTRAQISLAAYVNKKIRIAFYGPNRPLYIDKIGIGGVAPGAPVLSSPAEASLTIVRRPTLVVSNAVHAENFPLTYQFEVYSDAGLSNLVAQVPLVSPGPTTTTWPVDINLADNARYWWRCRAWYGTNAGPWMTTATFYVNTLGLPPLAVMLASPAGGVTIPTTNTMFSWYAGVDPAGDFIQYYDFQVDSDSAFAAPKVSGSLQMSGPVNPLSNVTISTPLSTYAGSQALQPGINYYWRVRAQDAHGMVGPWSAEPWYFILAGASTPAPVRATITRFQNAGGNNWYLQWAGPTSRVYLEGLSTLGPNPIWVTLGGPFSGSSCTFTSTNGAIGYYRLRSQ